MAGTRIGGLKAKAKNLANDPNFYSRIGSIGGRASSTGGFAADPKLARIAGAKGGRNRWAKQKRQQAQNRGR